MRVLLTGASGRIGTILLANLSSRYEWVLLDRSPPLRTYGFPFHQIDITDYQSLLPVFKRIEVVIHLAAASNPESTWDDLIDANVQGVYNVLNAAHQNGCRRVIFASSLHVVDGYPRDLQISSDMPSNPLTLYGATKAWGEAVGAYFAYQKNLSVLCLRIGWVKSNTDPSLVIENPHLGSILTEADLLRLFVCCLEAPLTMRFGIFHGISNNRYKRLDITTSREILGYDPQEDAFEIARRNQSHLLWRARRFLRKVIRFIGRRIWPRR